MTFLNFCQSTQTFEHLIFILLLIRYCLRKFINGSNDKISNFCLKKKDVEDEITPDKFFTAAPSNQMKHDTFHKMNLSRPLLRVIIVTLYPLYPTIMDKELLSIFMSLGCDTTNEKIVDIIKILKKFSNGVTNSFVFCNFQCKTILQKISLIICH